MQIRTIAVAVSLALACAMPVGAQTVKENVATAPGAAGASRTVEINATITAIDKATRSVTLKGPKGNEKTVVAGPEVVNFDQLKVGDQVTLQYTEALVLELKKGSNLVVGRTEQEGAKSAKPGAKPGAVAGRKVTVVGEVIDTDPKDQTITVRGPNRTVEIAIEDPAQFKRVAKGDKIEATYVEAVAIGVKSGATKK